MTRETQIGFIQNENDPKAEDEIPPNEYHWNDLIHVPTTVRYICPICEEDVDVTKLRFAWVTRIECDENGNESASRARETFVVCGSNKHLFCMGKTSRRVSDMLKVNDLHIRRVKYPFTYVPTAEQRERWRALVW